VAKDFVLVRLVRVAGADLNLFEFDYDVTWAGFFLNAEEKVYGRYGGRDAKSSDARLSLAGLRYSMQAALTAHRRDPTARGPQRPSTPLLAEEYPAAKKRRGECIHCHQVYEYSRAARKATGEWQRDERWVYPLPENVGVTLEVDRGDHVRAVAADSPAARAGIQAGDVMRTVNDLPVASFADMQYALHRAPKQGRIPVTWQHGSEARTGELELAEGWRQTNLTWRPSLLDVLPSLPVHGDDLTADEKKALGLPEKRLAFRQAKPVFNLPQKAGLRADDVIVGLDKFFPDMTMLEFLGYVRKNYLIGDKVTLHVLRDGKPVDIVLGLK
jgi:hypothetical protein